MSHIDDLFDLSKDQKIQLSQYYKEALKNDLFPLGFKLYKKTFFRVIGHVMQSVMLEKDGALFSVEFNILPLCAPIRDLLIRGYDITFFTDHGHWLDFDCDKNRIFDEIRGLLKENVLPIFQAGSDSAGAYEQIANLEKRIYTGVSGGIISQAMLAFFCIQAQDYTRAFSHYKLSFQKLEDAYQHRLELLQNDPETRRWITSDQFLQEYREEKELFERLSLMDTEYLAEWLRKRYAISLETLRHPRYP